MSARRLAISAHAARAAVLAFAFVAVVAGTSGCFASRAVGRSFASLLSSPAKVTKVKDPVRKDARLAVLWIGHATALVQIDDKFILTDPVLTGSVGQLSRRLVEPGIDPATLPPIDAVVVSHMHFDHLSLGTLEMIQDKVRMLVLPRGGTAYLTDFGFPSVELRRWQTWEKDGLRVTAVPVAHVGFRYGLDAAWMTHSFTGYVIEYHGLKVYFAGDTAYDQKDFTETGQRFPGIDVALLPISPIEPRDIMGRYHTDPAEAVRAFFDLGAKRMVPIHYGTFINSTDEPGDALRGLDAAKRAWDLGSREIATLQVGEQRVFVKKGEVVAPATPPSVTMPVPLPAARPASEESGDGEQQKSEPSIPDDEKLDD
jgi:N-acyl-phosphatidylethanolamine-hydrolysing phospholipase D